MPYSCRSMGNITSKKQELEKRIRKEHRQIKDCNLYNWVNNPKKYKKDFIEVYSRRCAYCGVSMDIVTIEVFQIDHYIPKASKRFSSRQENKAGQIDNLILSCQYCNRQKSNFEFENEETVKLLHPDSGVIGSVFTRGDSYTIAISDRYIKDKEIERFYTKIDLRNEIHRIDYLLMNIMVLRKTSGISPEIYKSLQEIFEIIKEKRSWS